MKIRTRILLVVLFVAIVPVVVTAWTSLGVHQRAFDRKLSELRAKGAQYGADLAEAEVGGAIGSIFGLAQRSADWPRLSPEEFDGVLWLLFSQLEEIAAVAVKRPDGMLAGPIAYLQEGAAVGEWAGHPELDATTAKSFVGGLVARDTDSGKVAIGEPFVAAGQTMIPIAFPVSVSGSDEPWVVGIALGLGALCSKVQERRPPGASAFLLDKQGHRLCAASGLLSIGPEAILGKDSKQEVSLASESGTESIASAASNGLGWLSIIAQPRAIADAPKKEIRNRSLFWVALGVVGACVAGVLLAGGIAGPIRRLEDAATEVKGGDFEHRIEVDSADELGSLANAFNSMSDEIQRWNSELNERVDVRTRELRDAQEQLLEARKQAAVASLSAGVAHEINNPLTGVLTLTQVMLRRAKQDKPVRDPVRVLSSIEREALRIAGIVEQMRALDESEEILMDQDVHDLIDEVTRAHEKLAADAGIEVRVEHGEGVPLVYCSARRLKEAISNIVDNGIKSMSRAPGTLTIRTRHVDGQLVIVEFTDTGCGIAEDVRGKIFEPFFTTKSNWQGTGLGLSVAQQAVVSHNGVLKVDSVEGEGTTLTMTIPAATKRAHLI